MVGTIMRAAPFLFRKCSPYSFARLNRSSFDSINKVGSVSPARSWAFSCGELPDGDRQQGKGTWPRFAFALCRVLGYLAHSQGLALSVV